LFSVVLLRCWRALALQSGQAQRADTPQTQPIEQDAQKGPTTKEILTDAAIIAILIAASIAANKASVDRARAPTTILERAGNAAA
jgi:hypothetical protein